jgi:tRNA threonylcarbamoyladenosine biosynthesis protein TsaB
MGLTLAIDTALAACTVGLVGDDGVEVASACVEAPRGHAERLVPMVQALLTQTADAPARIQRIAVTIGPGSYTGLRVGLAAARAFGMAWSVPVDGCTTLLPVALAALASGAPAPLWVVHDAGRGWLYAQEFSATGQPLGIPEALSPEAAAQRMAGCVIAGSAAAVVSGATVHPERFPSPRWIVAAAAPGALAPLYVRAGHDAPW